MDDASRTRISLLTRVQAKFQKPTTVETTHRHRRHRDEALKEKIFQNFRRIVRNTRQLKLPEYYAGVS